MKIIIGLAVFVSVNILIRLCMKAIRNRRANALRDIAEQNGLKFYMECRDEVFKKFRFLNKLQLPRKTVFMTYAHLIEGNYRGHEVYFFDFYYRKTVVDRHTDPSSSTTRISVMAVCLGERFPELVLSKSDVVSRIFKWIGEGSGLKDFSIEYRNFSQKFRIQAADAAFAKDFCNEEMVDFLLQNDDLYLEVEQDCLALLFEPFMKPTVLGANLDRLLEIERRLPRKRAKSSSG